MKRILSFIIALTLILPLAACGAPASEPGVSAEPTGAPVAEQMPEPEAPNAEPLAGEMPADEYARAVWYGFAAEQENAEREITQKEFADMLIKLVSAYKPEGVSEFRDVPLVKKTADAPIYRFHAAALLLYAAEAMDCVTLPDGGHPIIDGEGVDWDTYFAIDFDGAGVDAADFSEISAKLTAAWPFGGELDHASGAIEFAVARFSRANGLPLLDADDTAYMRNNDILTYREAAVAAVRLFESNIEIAALLPEDEAAAVVAQAALDKAQARREAILNSVTAVSYSGTAYYLSNSGDDAADGLSPETAWATVARLNEASLNSGDAALFERGSTWRGETLLPRQGVTYSTYGEGAKPRLIGSPENGAGADKWSLLPGTDNIWVYHRDMLDCGAVVLNESYGALKVLGYWDGTKYLNYLGLDNQTIGDMYTLEMQLAEPAFDVKEQLDRDLAFFSEASSELPNSPEVFMTGPSAVEPLDRISKGPLYLRCDVGNPGEVYESIEFITAGGVCDAPPEGCVIDNLFIGYSAGGISLNDDNITVQNCELAWLGGCVCSYSFQHYDGTPTGAARVGGGLNTAGRNITIRNNYLHETYEDVLSIEMFRGRMPYGDFSAENILISGNLAYHVGAGYCYYNWDEDGDPEFMFKNCVYEDNYVLFSGLSDWVSMNAACSGSIDGGLNLQEGCAIRNNVFFASRDCLFFINQLHPDTLPDFEGNAYIQYLSYPLLWLNEANEKYGMKDAESVIRDTLGDESGTYTILYSMRWDGEYASEMEAAK